MLSKGDFQAVTQPQPVSIDPNPRIVRTEAEIDAMWWISKQSRRLLKQDVNKLNR